MSSKNVFSFNTNMKKSKSADTLNIPSNHVKREKSYDRFIDYFYRDNPSQSDSSQDICVIIDDRSDISSIDREQLDSGVVNTSRFDDENLSALDQKVTKLNNMLQEQHLLLKALKDDILYSNVLLNNLSATQRPDLMKHSTETPEDVTKIISETDIEDTKMPTSLLDADKTTQLQKIDREIREALIEFLQSDDFKDLIALATGENVKEVINSCFSETFPNAYIPIMEQYHRRLLRHVTKTLENAFNELEAGSSSLLKSVQKSSRSLGTALEKHQVLLETNQSGNTYENLESTLQTVLKNELKDWREKLLGILIPQSQPEIYEENCPDNEPYSPISPPQPADPERSIIDQLMKSAEINKKIKEGDVNKSFEEALSSSDLSLVMAACRAADPDKVFSEQCSLNQSVLLSLMQQLATDMVHDTQLKCRYLEEAIINLNVSDQTTRVHLPLVVGEVRKHLSKFLRSFPSHVASRRITLIIMAANNLLK